MRKENVKCGRDIEMVMSFQRYTALILVIGFGCKNDDPYNDRVVVKN